MNKISHKQLESCRAAPKLWALGQSEGGMYNFSYRQALGNSICLFHETNDLNSAEQKLEGFITKHFKNERKIRKIRDQLQSYAEWHSQNQIITADSNVIIDYPFAALWRLGGYVSRIDVTEKGYRAVLFEAFDKGWKSQLRMPLVQLAVGQYLGRPPSEIVVGFHDLETNKTDESSYTKIKRDKATKEFETIGAIVQSILPPK
jgi:hypothetical protein